MLFLVGLWLLGCFSCSTAFVVPCVIILLVLLQLFVILFQLLADLEAMFESIAYGGVLFALVLCTNTLQPVSSGLSIGEGASKKQLLEGVGIQKTNT